MILASLFEVYLSYFCGLLKNQTLFIGTINPLGQGLMVFSLQKNESRGSAQDEMKILTN